MTNIVPVVLVKNDEYWLPYALKASEPFFDRYVIHDVGSTDRTRDIIEWFVSSNKDKEFYVKIWPDLPPQFQGELRNSMIAETLSDNYFILDGDEVYLEESYKNLLASNLGTKLYGVVKRQELSADLKEAYSIAPHHRLYFRKALFAGPHPGEYVVTPQNKSTEIELSNILCYHFHNCARSSKDAEVPKRLERRARSTYRPGTLSPIDILDKLPILKRQIEDFPRNPELERLLNV